ncbi:ARM repeat superfamily protein isoform X2 [Wolffia australiana]
MAATQGVKSLNTSSGRRRFVFKTFAQRVNEIDIDVFRSLDPLKAEPSEGSSFFRDCLLEWRELNTAEDFISFYDEFMPLVQTLPQILLHNERIFSGLLSRVNMKARLSLEPILRLIAALSRDILEEFLPFLPRLVCSFSELFGSGGERDSDVLEQVFTSWSYVLMYLQKYLTTDIVDVLRITDDMRYYPNNYIQEFMAEAVSFLLRNASRDEVTEGIKRVVCEATEDLETKKTGACALLWYVMRGTSSKLHSKAGQVLRLLMDKTLLDTHDAVVDVVNGTLQRLYDALEPKELSLACSCLLEEIRRSDEKGLNDHLNRLLSLLIYYVRFRKGVKIYDIASVCELVTFLLKKYITFCPILASEFSLDTVDKLLELVLSLLDVRSVVIELSPTSRIVQDWGEIFRSQNPRLLSFIGEVLKKDSSVINTFKGPIIRVLNEVIETSVDDVLYHLLMFFERGGDLNGLSENSFGNIQIFFVNKLQYWSNIISRNLRENENQKLGINKIDESDLSTIWGILKSCSHFFPSDSMKWEIRSFLDAVVQFLSVDPDDTADRSRTAWQSLGAASLLSYLNIFINCKGGHLEILQVLHMAQRNKSSLLLSAVAEYLGTQFRLMTEEENLEFSQGNVDYVSSLVDSLGENLSQPDKSLRISTLRILSYFFPSSYRQSDEEARLSKKQKVDASEPAIIKCQNESVISLLLSVEETPLSVATSRAIMVLISKIQMNITTGKVYDNHVPLLMNGLIGIFHNRFEYLWGPAIECISVLINKHKDLCWSWFVQYLEKVQSQILSKSESEVASVDHLKPDGLLNCFNLSLTTHSDSTPWETILTLLIRTLQKVPVVAEARSRHIIPLFFKFLGTELDGNSSAGHPFALESYVSKGWKPILREWLDLLRMMNNSRSLYRSQDLKDVLLNRLLDDPIPDTQGKVLDCLLNWKDDFLLPYSDHLKNLVTVKKLREELTTWSLAKESSQIEDSHRDLLIPIIIRILVAKVRKLKTLASRKHASVNIRRAILCFLAQLEVNELPPFFSLLLKPLFTTVDGSNGHFFDQFFALPLTFLHTDFLSTVVSSLSSKKKFSFLHVLEDVLRCFDESRIKPFLDLLLAILIKILEWCTVKSVATMDVELSDIDDSAGGLKRKRTEELKGNERTSSEAKDLRSLCLKIFCYTLNKYPSHQISSQMWDLFFSSVKPLIDRFTQDISGSEHPGPLLLCFVAMSKNSQCVSLLDDFLPKILSVLSLKTASESVTSSLFRFIENLLDLDSESDGEDGPVKRLLEPHLKDLFAGVCQFFQRRRGQRKTNQPAMEEIRVFKLLGKYVTETSTAGEFIDIVLPFFGKKDLTCDECMEGLLVIQGILPMIRPEASKKVLNVISTVLVSARLDIRLVICKILDGLSVADHSLEFLAKLLHDFNAISSSQLDEIDYDKRICAYETVTVELFSSLGYDRALIILSQCFNDIASDLILRQAASKALLTFIDFSSLYLSHDCASSEDKQSESVEGFVWTQNHIQKIISKFFLHKMSETMTREICSQKFLNSEVDTSIHKEWIILLREMVWKLSGVPSLHSMRPLCSEDPEVDFFHNIFHLQTHRRVKALSCFRNAVNIGKFSEEMMEKLFIPLFLTMMFEIKGGKGEHMKNAFIETLASISGKMQWKPYSSLLMKITSFIHKTRPDKQKTLFRLLISVLDTFHFCDDNVQRSLQHKILPQIQKFLDSDSEKINAPMSLAALKILKLLPEEVLESQLQSIVRRICNFLKNRLESIRDEARSVLAASLNVLGIGFLPYIVKVLQSTLKRGFEMQVLGYTVNFILSQVPLQYTVGALDTCTDEIISIAENDILGRVSEEETAKTASRMKEARKKKSFETIKLLSQNITFKTHALKLLSPVKKHLQNHLTMKIKSKLQMMLNCIASGIEANPSVDEKELFVFIYGLLEDSHEESVHHRNSHLITFFALGLLHNRLKNMKLNKKNEELLSMLDPFIKLLVICLSSNFEDVLSASFKCLIPFTRLPLPSLKLHADKIKTLLLDIAQRSCNVSSQLTQSCLKLLTALLRSTTVSLSDDELRTLLQFPIFIDIQSKPSHVGLSLFKSIVARKLVVPEVYDLVVHISELMVTSQEEAIRKKCSEILLQFLVDYRISSKRLQQHLDFLLANLSYEHPSGREAVLEMLHVILVKLPPAIVESQAQSWFLHLVVSLANDDDKNVQAMVAAVIKLLLGRISQKALHPILEYSLSWYNGEKKHLWSAAAQILGLLVDVLKSGFMKYYSCILSVAKFIIDSAIDEVTNKLGGWSSDLVPLWKEVYHTLLMLEKMLVQYPDLYIDQNFEEIWERTCKLLLHPHVWVRNASNRLLALYFSEVPRLRQKSGHTVFLNPGRLFFLSVSFCTQLKSKSFDFDTSAPNVLAQNLLFAVFGIHSHAKELSSTPVHVFWTNLSPHEQRLYLDAFDLLRSRKGRNSFLINTSVEANVPRRPEGKIPNLRSLLVFPLLGKLGKIALTGDDAQARIVFDCFRKISMQIGHNDCADYAFHLLSPLYRISEGFAGREVSDEIKDLANEVLVKIRGVLGAEQFVRAYNEVRKVMKEKRDKRKKAEKVLAVINPMRHAQRKLRLAAKHRAHKKKKVAAMKMKKWGR